MKRNLILVTALIGSFTLGFGLNEMVDFVKPQEALKRVTGIGGVFFKCKDPVALKAWYQKHLGLNTDAYGTNFEWRQGALPEKKGFTQWSPFIETTKYFPGQLMIDYRVADLERLLEVLAQEGVEIVGKMQSTEYGYFAHIKDLEGNKVELWQPIDEEYDKIVEGRTY